jgi:hypothetical protein
MMSYPIRNGQNGGICSSLLVFISQAIHYYAVNGTCKLLWNVTTGPVLVPLLVLLLNISVSRLP